MLDKRVDDVLIQSRRNDFRASEHAPLFSVVHGNPLDLSQIPVMDLAIKLDDLLEESNLIKSLVILSASEDRSDAQVTYTFKITTSPCHKDD